MPFIQWLPSASLAKMTNYRHRNYRLRHMQKTKKADPHWKLNSNAGPRVVRPNLAALNQPVRQMRWSGSKDYSLCSSPSDNE